MDLEDVKRAAWHALMVTSRYPRVALQIGYLIDKATTLTEVTLALAMIGDFETEEEAAAEEAFLSVQPGM